jgi:hypothetical protein
MIATPVIFAIQAEAEVINMKKFTLALVLILAIAIGAQKAESAIHVKYITGESVYLDAGSADSLVVGDSLNINHGEKAIAQLEIVYVAEHSASCKVINSSEEIKVGDLAAMVVKNMPLQTETPKPANDTSKAVVVTPSLAPIPMRTIKPKAARIDGSVALQLYRFSDQGPAHLNFTQPSMRFNLRASRLFGQDIGLTIRSDSRYYMRSRAYSSDIPKNEWRNRIYQFSLSFAGQGSPYNFEVGRIISNKFSGVGYIDGFLAQRKVHQNFAIGGYGGTQPQWQYSSFQASIQKYGVFASYEGGSIPNRFESSVAATGEYHSSIVSREFFFIRNSLNVKGSWNFYQSAEVDMNRTWRKQRTGQSFNMTNLYLSARGKLSQKFSMGLSYDNRRNFWTYETRTLADSLFDNVLRQGARADITFRPARTISIFSNFGYHKRTTDSKATYSYGAGFNKNNLFSEKQYLNLQLSGFSSPFTGGYSLTLTLGRYLWAGNMVSLGYSAYAYNFSPGGISRLNQSIQTNGQFDITRKVYFAGTFEYDTGKDAKGERFIGELGYRF